MSSKEAHSLVYLHDNEIIPKFKANEAGKVMPSMVSYHSTATTICTIFARTRN